MLLRRCQQGEPHGGEGAAPSLYNLLFFKLHTMVSPYSSSILHQQPSPGLRAGQAHCPRQRRPRQQLRESAVGSPTVGHPKRMLGKAVLLMPGTKCSTRQWAPSIITATAPGREGFGENKPTMNPA